MIGDAYESVTNETVTNETVTHEAMQELIAAGHGRPLLTGHRPVPVRLAHRWWHVPHDEQAADRPTTYVPAPAELATLFDRLAARRAAADDAVAHVDQAQDRA